MATSKIFILKNNTKVIITDPKTQSEKVWIHNRSGSFSINVDEVDDIRKVLKFLVKTRKTNVGDKTCTLREFKTVKFVQEKLYGLDTETYILLNSNGGYKLMDKFGNNLPGLYFDSEIVVV